MEYVWLPVSGLLRLRRYFPEDTGSKQLVRIPAWVELSLCTNRGKSPGQGVRMIYVSFLGDGWLGIPFGLYVACS